MSVILLILLILFGGYLIVDLICLCTEGYRNTLFYTVFFNQRGVYEIAQEQHVDLPRTRYDAASYFISNTKKLKEFPTITFSQFKDFYYLNPDSWTLCDYYAYKEHRKDLSVTFEYKEWKKYNKWHEQLQRDKALECMLKKMREVSKWQDETTIKILESVQRDIDNIRAESNKNFEEAAELIKGVNL